MYMMEDLVTTLKCEIVRNAQEKLAYTTLDFDSEMKATTESSDKKQTYMQPDGHSIFGSSD